MSIWLHRPRPLEGGRGLSCLEAGLPWERAWGWNLVRAQDLAQWERPGWGSHCGEPPNPDPGEPVKWGLPPATS